MATAPKKAAPAGAAKPAAAKPAAADKPAGAANGDLGESAFAFSNAARDQYDTLLKSFNDNAEDAHERAHEIFEAARESFETAQSRFQEVGAEAMEAARQDMADAVDFASELSRTKTVAEAMEVQRDYWSRFFETNMERTRTMTQTTADALRDSVEPMNRSVTTAFSNAQMPAFTAFFPFASK
ncbi:MAG: phasin family protein [Pseudomonadota bacterium]